MADLSRRHLLCGSAATAAIVAMPSAAIATAELQIASIKQAATIIEREETLSMIVARIKAGDIASGRLPQSGILSFGGRRIFIVDKQFKNEAEIFLFGDAAEDQWRLEDYGITPDDIIERAVMKLTKIVDTKERAKEPT